MSDWTNLEDIMQDLSVAQGCAVPASLETFGAACPPAYHVQEESEQQSHYESAGGDGDHTEPDYRLIQVMLNMVRETPDDQESNLVPEPVSQESQEQINKNKVKRNVALTSIMEAKEAERLHEQPVPADVISTMFKRKAKSGNEKKTDIVSPPKIWSPVSMSSPSTHTEEQSECMENEQIFEDNIWSKAQRQMKEIDARKKRSMQLTPEVRGFAAVHLDQHRHEFCDDCIVCIVAYKHGYHF